MKSFRIAFIIILIALLVASAPAAGANASSLFNEEGDKAYDILKNEVQSDTLDAFDEIVGGKESEGGHGLLYFSYLYEIYDTVFVILLIICWIAGPLIIALSKKNKQLKKFAWTYLIFLFPAVLIIIEYGVPYLYLGLV